MARVGEACASPVLAEPAPKRGAANDVVDEENHNGSAKRRPVSCEDEQTTKIGWFHSSTNVRSGG